MTPNERAKKIVHHPWFSPWPEHATDEIEGVIAAEISVAVEEMQEDRDRWADSACRLEKALAKAKAEAYEECAKIAEEHWEYSASEDAMMPSSGGKEIAQAIRARAKEVGK